MRGEIVTRYEHCGPVECLVPSEVKLNFQTAEITSPFVLLIAVNSLVMHEVGVVSLQDGRQRDASRLVTLLHLVVARPVEDHLCPGEADALYSKGAHGGVEWEDVEISLTVEDEVSPHGVENCPITVDPQSDIARVQIILECSVFDEVNIRLPDVRVVVNAIQEVVPGAVIMAQSGVLPPLLHDELHFIVQAGLVRRGEREQHHAHIHPKTLNPWRLDSLVIPQ